MELSIKELVKDNQVHFDSFRQGTFYYKLIVSLDEGYKRYLFTVPIDDIGTATLLKEDKAITYMRWIRKALEDKTLIEVK